MHPAATASPSARRFLPPAVALVALAAACSTALPAGAPAIAGPEAASVGAPGDPGASGGQAASTARPDAGLPGDAPVGDAGADTPDGAAVLAPTAEDLAAARTAFALFLDAWPGFTFTARYCGRQMVVAKGVRKVGAPAAIDGHTPLRLSSNSKAFTALAVLSLAARGALDLRATLGEIFSPEAALAGPVRAREGANPTIVQGDADNRRLAETRVLDLLQMQSGIAESSPGSERCEGYWSWVTRYTDREVLEGLVRRGPASAQHLDGDRSKHRYCNANYAILATVVERVTLDDFERVVQRLTAQLGMTETGIIDFAAPATSTLPNQAGKVTGHVATRVSGAVAAGRSGYELRATEADGQEDVGVVGDGEVWSTGEDIGKWLAYWLEPRVAGDLDPLLGRAAFVPSAGAVVVLTPGEAPPAGAIHLKTAAYEAIGSANVGYAFAWQRYGDYYALGKGALVAHGGATEGFRSTVEFYPYPGDAAQRAGFALLTNYHFEDLPAGAPEQREQFKAAEGLFARLASSCAPAR